MSAKTLNPSHKVLEFVDSEFSQLPPVHISSKSDCRTFFKSLPSKEVYPKCHILFVYLVMFTAKYRML